MNIPVEGQLFISVTIDYSISYLSVDIFYLLIIDLFILMLMFMFIRELLNILERNEFSSII